MTSTLNGSRKPAGRPPVTPTGRPAEKVTRRRGATVINTGKAGAAVCVRSALLVAVLLCALSDDEGAAVSAVSNAGAAASQAVSSTLSSDSGVSQASEDQWTNDRGEPIGTSGSGLGFAGQGGGGVAVALVLLPVMTLLIVPTLLGRVRSKHSGKRVWLFLSPSERPG